MNWALIVVGGLYAAAILAVAAGVWELHKAEQHWKAAEKIMRELEEKSERIT
mgnify:CR=1 FL=1